MAAVGINLAIAPQRTIAEDVRLQQDMAEFGGPVQLRLILPDGSDKLMEVRMGNSIQYIKSILHKEFDIPLTSTLIFQNKLLLDPLCLLDIDGIGPGEPNVVGVEV
eukprot:jgi/Botrbrau1/4633/Bobra.33_2s0005.1